MNKFAASLWDGPPGLLVYDDEMGTIISIHLSQLIKDIGFNHFATVYILAGTDNIENRDDVIILELNQRLRRKRKFC